MSYIIKSLTSNPELGECGTEFGVHGPVGATLRHGSAAEPCISAGGVVCFAAIVLSPVLQRPRDHAGHLQSLPSIVASEELETHQSEVNVLTETRGQRLARSRGKK